jgi:hypothetical protein
VVSSVNVVHDLPRRPLEFKSVLLLGVALIPVAFTAVSVAVFAVNTPWSDEWAHVLWLQKLAENKLSLHDLFGQQNEYRQFFPNLVFVLAGWLSKGDFRFPIVFSLLLACLVSFNFYGLARRQLDAAPSDKLKAYLAANVLIFSPIQYENWLQGQQLIYFIPIACLSACLLIAFSQTLATGSKFLSCAVLCTISTFSSANGILCWFLVLPILVRPLSLTGMRLVNWWVGAWIIALALNLVLYLHGYDKPSHHPSLATILTQPASAAVYFFTLLGRPLGFERISLAAPTGAVLLAAFGWACVQSWRQRRDERQFAQMMGWVVVGSYSVLTALLITIGRTGFGPGQALSSRYTTFTLYLGVSLVFLIPICIRARAKISHRANPSIIRPTALLAVLVVAYHGPLYLLGIAHMSNWQVGMLASKACVLLANVVEDDCAKLARYPYAEGFRKRATALERLGFLEASILKTNDVRDSAFITAAGAPYGSFVSLIHQGGDEYVAVGEALLPHRDEPAHLVLLAYQGVDGQGRVFAVTDMAANRDIVSGVVGRGQYRDAGWRKSFTSRRLPAGPVRLTAWGFDAYTGKAYALQGSHVLYKDTATSRQLSP